MSITYILESFFVGFFFFFLIAPFVPPVTL